MATSIAFDVNGFANSAPAPRRRAAALRARAGFEHVGTDETLMQAFCDGDEDAFATLYDRYKLAIYRYVYRRVANQGRAEEITADVFTAIVRYRKTWRPDALFKTYLYRIADNRCISENQRAERRVMVAPRPADGDEAPLPEAVAAGESPLEAAERREASALLYAAVARLPHDFREPILLELADFGRDEIAERLAIPVETVKTRIFRAKMKLKAILADERAQRRDGAKDRDDERPSRSFAPLRLCASPSTACRPSGTWPCPARR